MGCQLPGTAATPAGWSPLYSAASRHRYRCVARHHWTATWKWCERMGRFRFATVIGWWQKASELNTGTASPRETIRLCIACQTEADKEVQQHSLYNRRGSKDSQLR